jgi:Protein of unknown function (DUF4232)
MKLTQFAARKAIAAAAIAGAVILLPAAALASPGHGVTSHGQAAPPKCGVAMPSLRGGAFVWSANPGDGFAGGVAYELEVTNTGRHTCTLKGVPGLAAIHDGHLVGSKIPASPKGRRVVLRPFQTAHINLTVHDAGAACPAAHSVSAQVVVYLPGQSRSSDTFLTAQACPGKPGGAVLSAGAITAGVGIPLYTT